MERETNIGVENGVDPSNHSTVVKPFTKKSLIFTTGTTLRYPRNDNEEDRERAEDKEVENNILEFPAKKRVWVYRGLEWGYFKKRDVISSRPWIRRVLSVVDTAVHEMGHVYILRGGGSVISSTVIPSSRYQGLTIGIPNSRERRLMSLVGGLAAEEADGQDDHRGCGSDLYHLEVESQMYGLSKSEAESRARSEIGGQIIPLQREGLGLAIKGTIAA